MKKLKLVPGLILLALCVAILGIGIYAASPASNQISGTVTVNAANGQIAVSVYKNDVQQGSIETTRTGVTKSYGNITFDMSSANSTSDVQSQTIKVRITNNASYAMSGYFWNKGNATNPPESTPAAANIMTTSTIQDSNSQTVITATYDGEKSIAAGATVDFTVTLAVTNLTENDINEAAFNLYLVVYKSTGVNPTAVSFSKRRGDWVSDEMGGGWNGSWDGVLTVTFTPANVTNMELTWSLIYTDNYISESIHGDLINLGTPTASSAFYVVKNSNTSYTVMRGSGTIGDTSASGVVGINSKDLQINPNKAGDIYECYYILAATATGGASATFVVGYMGK